MIANNKFPILISVVLFLFGSFGAVAADSKASEVIEDTVITTKIKGKMALEPGVSALKITVETDKGIVTLVGIVPTEEEAAAATEIASSTEGVIDVNTSKLKVEKSHQPLADAIITAKVKGTFIREKLFGHEPISVTGIHVETKDGVVYLTGAAEDKVQAETAEKLAKSVNGVKKVESRVKVE